MEQLQAIFGYRNALVYPDRVFIPTVHKVLTETGQLLDSELQKRMQKQAEGFTGFVEKLRGKKLR